jgi:predicted enzyme involved in methoxymalonyl-ACP biosynthesis
LADELPDFFPFGGTVYRAWPVAIAAGLGAELVLGEYLPTPKNDVVADRYPRLGFSAVEGSFFARTVDGGAEDLVTYVAASA